MDDEPEDTVTAPPAAAPVPRPPERTMFPPTAPLAPTVRLIAPPLPVVAEPVSMLTKPESPTADVPDLTFTPPDEPAVLASAVNTLTDPVLETLPPETIDTAPPDPVADVVTPADNTI